MLGVRKFYCYHVNMGSLWSVKSFILPAFPLLDLCPSAKPIFQVFHNAAIITVSLASKQAHSEEACVGNHRNGSGEAGEPSLVSSAE